MSTSFTYATLTSTLQSITEDQGTEFAAFIPTIIQLAEDKVLRDLDLEIFDQTMTSAFVAESPWLTKPASLVGLRSLHYTTAGGDFTLLVPRSWEYCKDYWPNETTTTSTPKYFAEQSSTDWFIAGTPASSLVVTARYIKRPTGLSSTTSTTWLSTTVGDLLLYACLVGSEQYLKADDRVPVWAQTYADRLQAAMQELKPEKRTDYMPITTIPTKE